MWRSTFRVMGTSAEVRASDANLAQVLESLVGTYESWTGTTELRYLFQSGSPHLLRRNGQLLGRSEHWADLPPVFELDLYRQLVARHGQHWLIHAAALASAKGALVLAGPSGSGKSTLALALLDRGLRYMTDEWVFADRQGRVQAIPKPIGFGAGGPCQPLPARARAFPYLLRRQNGEESVHTLVHPGADGICRQPQPLHRLVLLRHDPASPPSVERLGSGEGLIGLWSCGMGGRPVQLHLAADLIERCPVHRVTTRGIGDACDRILALLSD